MSDMISRSCKAAAVLVFAHNSGKLELAEWWSMGVLYIAEEKNSGIFNIVEHCSKGIVDIPHMNW